MKSRVATICLIALLAGSFSTNLCPAKERPKTSLHDSAGEESPRDDLTYAPDAWPEAPDAAAMLKRLVVGTAIVLALCVGTLLVGQRWLRGAPKRATAGDKLRLIETVSLGNRCSVHLLQAGEHQVLVGIDSTGVKSLVPLPPSFEQAISEARSPDLEAAQHFEVNEAQAA